MTDSIRQEQNEITQQQALNDAVSIGRKYGHTSVEIRNVAAQIAMRGQLGSKESLALRRLYLEIEEPQGETRKKILNIMNFNNPREALYLRLSGITREATPKQRTSKSFYKQAFRSILNDLNKQELEALIDYICYEQPKGKTWLSIAAALRTIYQRSEFRDQHPDIYQKLKLAVLNTANQQKTNASPSNITPGASSSARIPIMESESLEDEYGGLGWVKDAFGS